MIINSFGEDKIWYFDGIALAEQEKEVVRDNLSVNWGSIIFPLPPGGEKLIESPRFENIATEDVISYLCCFFKYTHGNGSPCFLFFLFEFDGSR